MNGEAVATNGERTAAVGVTPSAWTDRGDPNPAPLVVTAAARPGPPGGGMGRMGGGGGFGGMGPALAPTPELMAKVAALPPATDEPGVDVEEATRPGEQFRFRDFLRGFRGPLIVGLVLVALDGLATIAGPALIRYGIDEGVAKDAPRALWIASLAFLVITLADWWVMWAQTRVLGKASERMLFALRVKVFAHLQRLGIDYFEREMAGRVMTRMTTDIDGLSQFLQTGVVTALVNGVSLDRRRGRARDHGLGARARRRDRAAAAHRRHRLVPTQLEPGLRQRPPAHRDGRTRTSRRVCRASACRRPTSARAPTRPSSRTSPAGT